MYLEAFHQMMNEGAALKLLIRDQRRPRLTRT
jgi:hypothetical protein